MHEKKPNLLRLNLQHFAEQDEDPADKETGETKTDETETGGDPEKTPEPKTFTQEELDRHIQDRLERERKKKEREQAEAQRQRDEEAREQLKEQEKYKELAESLQKQIEDQKAETIEMKKESLLAQAGYSESQVTRFKKYLDGDTEDALNASLADLKEDIPPKPKQDEKAEKTYGDPSAGNGHKTTPKKTNLQEKGQTIYQRLKASGKVKGK